MKNKASYRIIIGGCIILLLLLFCLRGYDKKRMWDYYANQNNFCSSTGVVTYIHHDAESKQIFLSFSDIDPVFEDNVFKIVGKNYDLVMENELLAKLSLGDHINFVGSPRVFGDGYVLHLIAISREGELFLEESQGYPNFIAWLKLDQ